MFRLDGRVSSSLVTRWVKIGWSLAPCRLTGLKELQQWLMERKDSHETKIIPGENLECVVLKTIVRIVYYILCPLQVKLL